MPILEDPVVSPIDGLGMLDVSLGIQILDMSIIC